jgi:hypothetical protein
MQDEEEKHLYIYIDEGGNFDFSPSGTRYFVLSCVTLRRPFEINSSLDAYKYDCLEWGLPQEYFHCTDDNKHVREKVFSIISDYAPNIRLESLIIDKRNVPKKLQEAKYFYPAALGNLLTQVISDYTDGFQAPLKNVIVITDTIPINKKRRAIEKTIKHTLKIILPPNIEYQLFHHASRAHYGLQITDYCNWAVLRKYEKREDYFTPEYGIPAKLWITYRGENLFTSDYQMGLLDIEE